MPAKDFRHLDQPGSFTQEKFSKLLSRFNHRALFVGLGMFLGFLLWAELIVLEADWMNGQKITVDSPLRLVGMIGSFATLFGVIIGTAVLIFRSVVPCPSCRRPLISDGFGSIVLGTRRCPHCSRPVFVEDLASATGPDRPPEEAATVLMTIEEAKADENRRCQKALRPALNYALVGIALGALGVALTEWATATLGSRLGELGSPFVRPLLLFPGISVGFWGLAVYGRHYPKGEPRCSQCGDAVSGRYGDKTGRCGNCGTPWLADATPGIYPDRPGETAPRGAPFAAEFAAAAKRLAGRLWIGCFLGGGLASLWLVPMSFLGSHGREPIHSAEMGFVIAIVGAMGMSQCGGVFLWHRYLGRNLSCPACHQSMLEFWPLVVCTTRCPSCGVKVLQDPR